MPKDNWFKDLPFDQLRPYLGAPCTLRSIGLSWTRPRKKKEGLLNAQHHLAGLQTRWCFLGFCAKKPELIRYLSFGSSVDVAPSKLKIL